MPTIEPDAGYVTQINHLKVAPEDQSELLRRMAVQVEEVISRAPGFISSTLHASEDGGQVVNYVQFETAAQLDEVHRSPAFASRMAAYSPLVREGEPLLYRVAFSRQAGPDA